jgi:hypothetical protein
MMHHVIVTQESYELQQTQLTKQPEQHKKRFPPAIFFVNIVYSNAE